MAEENGKKRKPRRGYTLLSDEEWNEIRDVYENTKTPRKEICKKFNMSSSTLATKARRAGWKMRNPRKSADVRMGKAIAKADREMVAEAVASRQKSMRKLIKFAEETVDRFVESGAGVDQWKDLEPVMKIFREATGATEGKGGDLKVETVTINNKFGLPIQDLASRPEFVRNGKIREIEAEDS